jgi:hypothetical protein
MATPMGPRSDADDEPKIDLKSLLERVKKLLRLAAHGSGATEAEASAALDRANALLLKANLTMGDVATGAADGIASGDLTREDLQTGHTDIVITNEDWKIDLARAIAKANLCKVITHRGRDLGRAAKWKTWAETTISIIGLPANREVVIELFQWVLNQIDGRGGLYGTAYQAEYGPKWAPKPSVTSPRDFRYGFHNGISKRLVERVEEHAGASGRVATITALATAHDQRNMSYARATWEGLGAGFSQNTRQDAAAWSSGYAAGNRVSLGVNRLGNGPRGRLGSGG